MLKKIFSKATNLLNSNNVSHLTPEWATFHSASTDRALTRIFKRELEIKSVIDVGASDGSWSKMCMGHIPDASYFLVEAQNYHLDALDTFCSNNINAQYILSAAGDYEGECFFDDTDPFGGCASHSPNEQAQTSFPMTTLDSAVNNAGLNGPYLLKLDTHGFEVPILNGAQQLLTQANLVVIETYIFKLNQDALLFHEMCTDMARRGFRVVDFSEPLWREKDMALWQWDLFFIRDNNPVFNSNSYK
ncbi:MAG: FkbM family methyltransferase [Candidatus Bathyarchaeota archaeon]|nr:FkbM family methyltransferase [Candidatus Bathyarchaeum sp.]